MKTSSKAKLAALLKEKLGDHSYDSTLLLAEIIKDSEKNFSKRLGEVKETDLSSVFNEIDSLKGKLGSVVRLVTQFSDENGILREAINSIRSSLEEKITEENLSKSSQKIVEELIEKIEQVKRETRLNNSRGGSMNRQILVNGVNYLTRYTDINLLGSITAVTDDILHTTDITFLGGGGGGGGFVTINATEIPNGSRKVFTFPSATSQPIFIDSDNALMRAVAADGTVNWTWNSSTNQATMTIPPNDDIVGIVLTSGASGTEIDNEIVSGSGTSFTLAQQPILGSQHIYARGQRLTPTVDYSISGTAITTVDTWNSGDILADYEVGSSSTTNISNEIASGSGTSFTLSHTPLTGSEKVYARGQRLTPTVDFSISGSSITTTDTWGAGDILVDYSV